MKKIIKPLLALIFLAVVGVAMKYFVFDSSARSMFISKFEEFLTRLGFWGPVMFVIFYIISVSVFIPASLPSSIGGLVFGQWMGLLLNFTGAMIGSVVMFYMCRYLFRDMAVKLLSAGHFKKFDDRVADHGFSIIVYLRLMFVPFGYVNAAAGVSKMRFKDYFWASAVSLPPGLAVITFLTGAVKNLMLTYKSPADFLRLDIILPLVLFIFSFFNSLFL